jgi:phosphoribosylanthranilate isomerase
MNVRKSFLNARMAWSLLLALVPLGCSKGGSVAPLDPKSEAVHIAKAGHHVAKYITENKGKAPKNTGEMKDWAAKNNIPEDELLSTRDHEPYEIHQVAQGPLKDTVLTETTGAKGKKFMWQSISKAPVGSEATQEQIDNAIKSSGAIRPGGPPG